MKPTGFQSHMRAPTSIQRTLASPLLASLLAAAAACSSSESSPGIASARVSDLAGDANEIVPAGHGVPTAVDPGADLGIKPDDVGTDSIYITGRVAVGDDWFGYLLHVLRQPARGAVIESVSITDESRHQFLHHQQVLAPDELAWSPDALDLHTGSLSWTGDDKAQRITMTFPFGALDLELHVQGPVLYYGGVGTWPMLGYQQWQYALTGIRTSGTLTLAGKTSEVTGESWLDRQWGALPDLSKARWTWLNIALPDGDKLAVWDIVAGNEAPSVGNAWATVLHPDGTHELLPVAPLEANASRKWTSPATGKTFPTQWVVSIPSRDTELIVISDILEQELSATGIYEGLATVTGTYRGIPVEAKTYVEQVGNWQE